MAHEDLTRKEHIEGSSDRGFGLVFTLVFAVIAAWPLIQGSPVRWWSAAAAALFAVISVLRPSLLSAPNKAWTRLGQLMGAVVSPIALGVVFFLVITPTSLLMRMAGKDPLRLKRDPTAPSYWIKRQPPGPAPDSLTRQF